MPPPAVSFKAQGSLSPTLFIASIASSALMKLLMPDRASWAAKSACSAQAPLRLMQGTSTRPATGSHTRPSTFLNTMATAVPTCSALPPSMLTAAPAAMAAALPHSAWQPPVAPASEARSAITMPILPATTKPRASVASLSWQCFFREKKTPGRTPLAPAVGAATIRPMAALHSPTAMA